jgi:hypothetical protein
VAQKNTDVSMMWAVATHMHTDSLWAKFMERSHLKDKEALKEWF